MYFSKFPLVKYPIKDGNAFRFVYARNVLRRIILSDGMKSSDAAFIQYDIKDGERPEHIAEKLYGDVSFHWLVLLTNEIIDPYHDWYKSDAAMQDYIQKKYSGYSVYFTDHSNGFTFSSMIAAGATLYQGSVVSRVESYNQNMCSVTVNSSSFTEGSAAIIQTNGVTFPIRIHRIDQSPKSAHHFEMQKGTSVFGASDTITLDPLAEQISSYTKSGQSIGTTAEGGIYAKNLSNTYLGTLVVLENGRIFGWGDNRIVGNQTGIGVNGVMSYPQGLTRAKAVHGGLYHAGAILEDDTVVMWGLNNFGQATPPTGLTGVSQLSCSWYHTTALLKDSRGLTSWGSSDSQRNFPANPSTIVQIDSGGYHTVGLRNDGTVVCWGDNSVGQCNVPAGLLNVTQIAAGHQHSCALKSDGTVVCWGTTFRGSIAVPPDLNNVVKIAGGYYVSHALKSDGTVVSWGEIAGASASSYPRPTFTGVSAMSGKGSHCSILFQDGSVKSFGRNIEGQANDVVTKNVDFHETYLGNYMGVADDKVNTYAVSNYIHEVQKNDEKRTLKLLHPRYKEQAVRELEALLRV